MFDVSQRQHMARRIVGFPWRRCRVERPSLAGARRPASSTSIGAGQRRPLRCLLYDGPNVYDGPNANRSRNKSAILVRRKSTSSKRKNGVQWRRRPSASNLKSKRPSGGLKPKEMEHREAHHLEGMNIFPVQNIQVEGRHSDQSCRHATKHRQTISLQRAVWQLSQITAI